LPFTRLYSDHDVGFLLVRRSVKPHIGGLCFPGGFIDWGESWQEGMSREIYEETNVITDPNEFDLISVNSTPDNKRILIFGMSKIIRRYDSVDNFISTNETSELVIGCTETKLCFSLHQQIFDRMLIEIS
jgi:8-oxo-dGTP pyrophosphatase MutT (NUDIX family)